MDKEMNNLLWDILKDHFGHRVEIAVYGDPENPACFQRDPDPQGLTSGGMKDAEV